MADTDDSPAPQSIQERIAALKLNQVGRTPNSPPPTYEQVRKSKPPPPPLPKRSQTASAPPTASNNGEIGNTPAPPPRPPVRAGIGANNALVKTTSREVLPAPVMKKWEGRDQPESPALPPRRPSERAVPSLPPRRPSEQSTLSRKQSTDSISSIASRSSSISGMSLKSNGERRFQIRAPEYDPATLPPLPERKVKEEEPRQQPSRVPLRPTVSAPNVPRRSEEKPPALPGRPPLPVRNGTGTTNGLLPPPAKPRRSILEMGFNNKPAEDAPPPPLPSNRPNGASNGPPLDSHAAGGQKGVVEMTASTFDDVVFRGNRPVLVDFYAPFCKYCKEFDPRYEELAASFKNSDITFARIDSYTEKEIGDRYKIESWPTIKLFDGRGTEIAQAQFWSENKWFEKFITEHTGIKPGAAPSSSYPTPPPSNSNSPPPIPTSSRPNLADLNKTKPKFGASASTTNTASTGECLQCRDFSAPDAHAARFPRQSIPSQEPSWLGPQLCNPFPSHTDKARAIFTWLHHNIDYNVQGFFSGNIPRGMTPKDTIASGLAVCEGYASVFTALATAAGLESVVVGGHGKGFGFNSLRPGQPLPRRDPSGHAWNAVRIDGGAWKLIDPCWGAGNVSGKGQPYNRAFNPSQFTMSNDEFGTRHYPENSRYFFRDDGRPSITWEEYIMFSVGPEERTVFTTAKQSHGFDDKSFLPKANDIVKNDYAAGPTVRFQWTKICPHYDIVKHHGHPYCYFIKVKDEERYVQTDGYNYWVDVRREELPNPGEEMNIQYVQKFMDSNGEWRDARGESQKEIKERRGWRSWSYTYVARWKVV